MCWCGRILGPGDVLYIPRGFIHATATPPAPQISLHLTVSLHTALQRQTYEADLADLAVTLPPVHPSIAELADHPGHKFRSPTPSPYANPNSGLLAVDL